jgi:SOS-response transcriptional repressor LexA
VKDLTARQHEILDFIRFYIGENSYPPTLREISAHFGWSSTNASAEQLNAIERKGFIEINRLHSRGIRILGGVPRAAKIDGAVDAIRTLRRAYFRVGVKLSATNEPLFVAAVRKVLEETIR